jgi:putative DNA primase/helicase
MSIKDLLFADDENDVADLASYAALLKGEIDGEYVRCASPGRSRDDRSCFIRFTGGGGKFFVYDCEGPVGAAYAYVRKRLKLAPTEPSEKNSAFAVRIFEKTVPASGTAVETYLRTRGITLPIPPSLRFHEALKHSPTGGYRPAMVAARTSVDEAIRAIHRTYLKREGTGKASVTPSRMDLGPQDGGAIRLAPVADELLIGEGIETSLSAMQLLGLPGWAAGSAQAMRALKLPPEVKSVIVLADNDAPGEAAARYSSQRWLHEGRRVRIARPPKGFNDFNDHLLAKVTP